MIVENHTKKQQLKDMAKTISILPATTSTQNVCDPCSRESTTIDCHGYCTDCRENLCEECINHHRKLKLTLGHKIVQAGKLVPLQNDCKVIQRCSLHSSNEMCSFCEEHNKLCCSVCESVDHKNCKSVFRLADYATKAKVDETVNNLKKQLQEAKDEYNTVVNLKDSSMKNLEKQKDDALKAITENCNRIFNMIDKLRNKTVKKVMACFSKATEMLENTVKDCQERSLLVDKHMKNLEITSKSVSDLVSFIDTKLIEIEFHRNTASINCHKTQIPELEFIDNNGITELLQEVEFLAEVGVFGEHRQISTTRIKKNGEKGKFSGSISDMAILNDGMIVTCDYHHSQLVLLDSKLNYLKHLHLPFAPTGICVNKKSNNVIVSHKSKFTLVSLIPCTEVKNTIDIKKVISYNGIQCHDGEVYTLHSKSSAVCVHDFHGKLDRNSNTQISSPAGLAVSPDGTWVAVSSFNDNSVVILDNCLNITRKIESISKLKGPFSLEIDVLNRLYISIKNNVLIITPDSKTIILDDNDSLDGWPIVKHCKFSGKLMLVTNPWKSIAVWQP